ncbi:E3 ubiquitin-protein ligase mbr2 [Phtheirospermum japonicum]|uniref:RING-type E3 ubiquitin transferase n=1 Tax=Phtheirospermum japonicum TaxID=374723 RepID=A0A830CI56_9LAMI|nr:E3 ubiquitin-protein ligase mbr2 [Phtheirospermum japonicum]
MDPPEFMTLSKRRDLILAHLVFDVRGHSVATRNRLHSAANFILQCAFDNPHNDALDIVAETESYLRFGDDNRRNFMGAKLMALSMIHLEDAIMKSYPNWGFDELSNETLRSMIEEQLGEKESVDLQEPMYPEGTGLSHEMILPVLKMRAYAPKPENSTNNSADCHICRDELIEGDTVAGSNYCGHEFHFKCMLKWLYDHRLCPMCRSLVLPPQVEYPDWIKDVDKVRDFLNSEY